MSVWLVADDLVQIIRADSVVSFTAVQFKDTAADAKPAGIMGPPKQVSILAATSASRDTTLAIVKGSAAYAVQILIELVEAIAKAQDQLAGNPQGCGQSRFSCSAGV